MRAKESFKKGSCKMNVAPLRIPVFDSNSVRVKIGYLNFEEFNSAAFRPDRVDLVWRERQASYNLIYHSESKTEKSFYNIFIASSNCKRF